MEVRNRRLVRPDIFFFPDSDDSRPSLLGSSCRACKSVHFPPKTSCPDCFAAEVDRVALSRRGTVYSYATVRQAPRGFQAPYILAYVDLPEGLRLLAQLTCLNETKLSIGMDVELVIEPVRHADDGTEIVGFKFRPVR
jgi:uncharacterized OB-fold protein